MGLDMYAFATQETPASPVDFKVEEVRELHYWRKHSYPPRRTSTMPWPSSRPSSSCIVRGSQRNDDVLADIASSARPREDDIRSRASGNPRHQ